MGGGALLYELHRSHSSEPQTDETPQDLAKGSRSPGIGGIVAISLCLEKCFQFSYKSLSASERIYFSSSGNGKCSTVTITIVSNGNGK